MPSKAIFDNATLADAVNKAARVAPVKGPAFDQANGILFKIEVAQKSASIRATDLETTFMQDIPILETQGDNVSWRIPSQVLSGLMSQLPMSPDSVTEFIDRGDSWIRLKSDKLIAKLSMQDASTFPQNFDDFSGDDMPVADQLAARVEQVAWAVDPKSQILSGIHIDGKRLVACNQYLLATMPCDVPIEDPVTVPLASLSVLLKSGSSLRCKAKEKRFLIHLDKETKITATVLAGKFPNIDPLLRTNFVGELTVHRQSLIDALNRIMVLIRQERLPVLRVEVAGNGLIKMITVDMEVPDVGRMQNSVDIQTEFDDAYDAAFAPKMFLDAISNSKAEYIKIGFGHPEKDKSSFTSICISDDQGYTSYVMPRKADNAS